MVRDPVCMMELDPRKAPATAEYEGKLYYFCSDRCRKKFLAQPKVYINKAPDMRLTIGLMGSASYKQDPNVAKMVFSLGQAIAKRGFILITGACPGLPYECAKGARSLGGLSIGISPALSLDEHIHKYDSPSDAYDAIIYTGSGLMGREVTNIRSSDMVIIAGGSSGTLGEFAIAYDEGKLIGILQGSGGIVEEIPKIVNQFDKDTGAQLIYNTDPDDLIEKLSHIYTTEHYKHPSCFCESYSKPL